MGFLDRGWAVISGLGGGLQAIPGLVRDLVTAPFRDEDDFNGFLHTLNRRGSERLGQLFGNLFGPREGFGALLGGVPKAIRDPVSSVMDPVLQFSENVYQQAIAEPIATAITASTGAVAGAAIGPAAGAVTRAVAGSESYGSSEAHRIVEQEKRSPGQALALAFLTKDVTDPEQVAVAQASDAYNLMSGTADAISRFFLDPTVVAGKAVALTRARLLVKPVKSLDDIERAMASPRVDKFLDALAGQDASAIRSRHFPDHEFGAPVSTILAEAPTKELKADALRALMGDGTALARVSAERASIADQVARLQGETDIIRRLDDAGIQLPEHVQAIRDTELTQTLDELYPEMDRLSRIESSFGAIREVPRVRTLDTVRTQFYQKSIFSRPLRSVTRIRPLGVVNLEDTGGDVQLSRFLQRSDLDADTQGMLRNDYMRAMDPGEREAVLVRAEESAIQSIASNAGMSVEDIDNALGQAARIRGQTRQTLLRSRTYDAKGRSILRITDEDGTVHELHLPLLATQTMNLHPLADLDQIRRVTTIMGDFRLRHPSWDIAEELMTSFSKLWKPGVLLRVGWPVRVVADEQLRMMATIGGLTQAMNVVRYNGRRLKEFLGRTPVEERARGSVPFIVRDYPMQAAFGAPGDSANVYRTLASSRASFERLVGTEEAGILKSLREKAEWRTVTPDMDDYGPAWERVVNLQIRQDPLAKLALEGRTTEEMVNWLRSRDGLAHRKALPFRRRDLHSWAAAVREMVDDYTGGRQSIKDALRDGPVTAKLLADEFPDMAARPLVHGEVTSQVLGNSQILRTMRGFTDKAMDLLGRWPTDVLSRHPYFDHLYRAEVDRLVNLLDDQVVGQIDDAVLRQVEQNARVYAVGQTRRLLYDIAESSDLAHHLRFIIPFFQAWQETLTVWSKLAIKNPAFIARMRLVLSSPEKAGLVRDENGAVIDEDGNARDPLSGKAVEAGEDRYITLRMPKGSKIPGAELVESVAFNKKSLNMLLQGTPGFGPLVQIPVNRMVKDRPDLEESLKFVLPLGVQQSEWQIALPTFARRAHSLASGEEDRSYMNAKLGIYAAMQVDYNLGKRDEPPTFEEAEEKAKAFFKLRTIASFVAPVAPGFKFMYQPYLDAYRRLVEDDPLTADDRFLDTYGEEYFAVVRSVTKSLTGVPPTVEGKRAQAKYAAILKANPDLGGLIIGAEGSGEFSRAVYEAQIATGEREPLPFEEAATQSKVSAGWHQYGRLMDLLEAERVNRGLPNLQVKEAQDLSIIKRVAIFALGKRYPEWQEDFENRDEGKWRKRIDGMRSIVNQFEDSGQIEGRPDIQGLRDYLKLRDMISAELLSREHVSLDARANQDLALIWQHAVGKMVEGNLAFSSLYARYLEHDPIEVNPLEAILEKAG